MQVQRLIGQLVEEEPSLNWLREQAKSLDGQPIDHLTAKLRKPGLEAKEIEARIATLYAEAELKIEEGRIAKAEARALEIRNRIAELRLALGMTKALLIGTQGDEAVLFGRQIDAMLHVLQIESESTRIIPKT
jgi:hypothetical protein